MAALRIACRKAASSIPVSTKRCGGGADGRGPAATGLALYGASNDGEPLRALYRGGNPSPFPSGGRWAALITRGVRATSTLAAPPPTPARFLGTGGKIANLRFPGDAVHRLLRGTAVGDNPSFLVTGGDAVRIANPVLLVTGEGIADPALLLTGEEIADPALPVTGEKIEGPCFPEGVSGDYLNLPGTAAVAVHSKIAHLVFMGTGNKIGGPCFAEGVSGDYPNLPGTAAVAGPCFLSTGVGGVSNLRITSAITQRPRTLPWYLSASPPFNCAVRSISTMPTRPDNDDPNSFSRRWMIEHQLGIYLKLIEDAHKSAVSNAETIIGMLKTIGAQQTEILKSAKMTMTFKDILKWSPLFAVLIAVAVVLVAVIGAWYISRILGHDNCKSGFTQFVADIVHQILQDPQTKKYAEPYAEMGYDACRRAIDPFYRWWWSKGNKDDHQVSPDQLSDAVTNFAFVVMIILTSAKGICEEEELMDHLKSVGLTQKATNSFMIDLLIKAGYLTKETKKTPQGTSVLYHPAESALKECLSGEMKTKLKKFSSYEARRE